MRAMHDLGGAEPMASAAIDREVFGTVIGIPPALPAMMRMRSA